MSFDVSFEHVVGIEGGYSNNARDSGGATRFGITEATARAMGYRGDMRDLPLPFAKTVYRLRYWNPLMLDAIDDLCPVIAIELFDTGVNMGQGIAAGFLQTALNAFNRMGTQYPDVIVDGSIGPMTVEALRRFLALRGTEGIEVMLKALNCLQGARYIELAHTREKDEEFVYGWIRNRIAL